MQRRLSILLSMALGAAILVAPSLSNIGSESIYDSAFAAKGGNGKGKGGSKGASASKGSGNGADSQNTTKVASTGASKKQKTNAKQLALTDPLAPAHPSMLGRWNAAKPMTHPSMLAHIRNGNFNGTIGMLAAYGQAQTSYNDLQAQAAAAEAAATTLATELAKTPYLTVEAYEAALETPLLDGTQMAHIPALDDAIAAAESAPAAPTADDMAASLADLDLAEANMEAYSNRAPWDQIRDDVRMRMGLDPEENDLVTVAPPLVPAATP